MEAHLLALALEELALHPFPGVSFDRLCELLQEEHQLHLDPFVKGVLWRSLYECPVAVFTSASACGIKAPEYASLSSIDAPRGEDDDAAARESAATAALRRLAWRDPSIPPDLLPATKTSAAAGSKKGAALERDRSEGEELAGDAVSEARDAAAAHLPSCVELQERCWLLSTSAAVSVRLLTPMDFGASPAEVERRAAEVPFQVLRSVARQKEHGQWQYRVAEELQLEPKSVFHHLKPLYRDDLICHMQLSIPPGHKSLMRLSPSDVSAANKKGRVESSLTEGGPSPRSRGGGGAPRANLTMSALLWSSKFFCPLRLPAAVRGLMTLHHLLPLQQQAVELLRSAPNCILLEDEVRHFCTSRLLNSDQASNLSNINLANVMLHARYLRFSDKQIRRLFHRLREALERGGKVKRVRAFCKQTMRYERCLLFCGAEGIQGKTPDRPALQHAEDLKTERQNSDGVITQVKVEEGTLAATAAQQLREAGGSQGTVDAAAEEGDEDPSVVLEAEGTSLAALASLLLKAAGPEGVTTILFARLLGLDNKRSGKILTDFHRRKLATRVAERRGKCFLYRYISADLPHLQGLLEEASAPSTPEAAEAAASGANEQNGEALAADPNKGTDASAASLKHADATDGASGSLQTHEGGSLHSAEQHDQAAALAAADATTTSSPPAVAAAASREPQGEDAPPVASRGRGGRGRRGRGSASVASQDASASASVEPPKRKQRGGARGRGGSRKRLRVSETSLPVEADVVKEEQQETETEPAPEAATAAAPAAAIAAASSVESPPSPAPAPAASQANEVLEESNAGGHGESEQRVEPEGERGGPQRDFRQHIEQLKAKAATKKLPARTVRLFDTPQFVARLALFQETIRSAGCSTIPTISKAIADMEQTANGPDRKTVQRMAEVAMQLEPQIRRGRLAPSKAASSPDRPEEQPGSSPNAAGEITFFYWAETFDEATAEQRIATLITQRRARGCRDAIRRNQLLLDGKLKEASEELRLAGSSATAPATPLPSKPSSGASPATAGVSDVGAPPVYAMREGAPPASPPCATAESLAKAELVDQQLRGLQGEISRLALLESRSSSSSVTQPSPAATAASLLVVEKGTSLLFVYTPLSHWRRLAVSTMVKRMPLESFLRLVGCGYALPMLDQHLAKDSASRQPMAQLPGVLFRLLVFSSRQIQCYRQLHPKAKMPLLGLAKKNAGTAIRKLLSLLTRMGIVSKIQDAPPTPLDEASSLKSPPTSVFWRLNETLHLPAFCTAEGVDVCEAKSFDGLSHEGVEAYWQQLQHQVSQWMLQAQRTAWAFDGGPEASQFFSPHSEGSEEASNPSDLETADGLGTNAAGAPHTRKRLRPPKGFDVPEAFNSKNWKGQIAFSGSARAAMDAFAAETLEKLRDAGGDELEAVVLNASSPQIAELAARIGCPTDAVLRYLIRVFEIKGGPERNHALLVGGAHTSLDSEERGVRGEEALASPPSAAQADGQLAVVGADESLQREPEVLPVEAPARQQWLGVATKVETKERDRGVGLIVHRTREVRFQCHLCGHFYSWEKSIRLHYEKAHREPIPADEALYVLPWERKRRQEDKQQQAELSKFKRRRRTLFPVRETESAVSANHAADAEKAASFFINRLPTRGTVKAVEAPAKGFLLRATQDEEAVLASMSREDEITLIGAAIVAERLWQALQAAKEEPSAGASSVEARDTRCGPLTDAWLSPGTPQSFPPEDHLIWQILGWLCRPPLPPASARLYVGFVLSRRALNARIYSSFRRLQPAALRHFVLEGRIPSALEIRVHCFPRDEEEGPRKSLVCRPLSSPRVLMARNVLKAIVFTPLPFYRPALLLPALRELRPLELSALWRAWQRRGWVTGFKLTSAAPTLREKTENEEPAESAARLVQSARRPEIAAALESKCRRPFVLSSGARLSLFGRLRDYRSLSALLDATISMASRTHALSPSKALDSDFCEGLMNDQEKQLAEERQRACSSNQPTASSPAVHDIQLSHLEREEGGADAGGGPAEDADLHLLQLLESEGVEQPGPTSHSSLDIHPSKLLSAESQPLPATQTEALAVVGSVSLPVDSQLSGFEVLAALEGLARGQLWLSPFWGADGRLPDSPEAADDAALLNLLEEEEALDAPASGGREEGAWTDVPEWLHALSLGPGEDAGELLAGRPQRKATEGGIETHITAHAAGVAEITAVTCAALGAPKGAPLPGGPLARLPQRKKTAGENLPQADGSVSDTKQDVAEKEEGDMPHAYVGSICKELGAAFSLNGDAVGGGGPRAEARDTVKGFTLQPASHLPDGLFGAAGEYDAFDPSLLPPVFTDRTASAAIALTDREAGVDAASAEGLPLQPGLLCGFPLSLPTYANDHKQQWRLATKAAEAFAPRGCTCSAACKGSSTAAANAAAAAAASAAPASAHEAPCSPVPPCPVFAKGVGSSSSAPLEREHAQPGSEDACADESPIEILFSHLQEVRARQAAAEVAAGGLESLADSASRIPPVLLKTMHSVARLALHVQQHSLLPLLPTPSLPLAGSLLQEQIEKEEVYLQEASLAGDDSIPGRSGIQEETDENDLSISASLILCSACLLAVVLKSQAEGVAVPHLLTEISREKDRNISQDTQQCSSSLHDASRLSFLCASAKLARAFSNCGGERGPLEVDWGALPSTAMGGPPLSFERMQWDSSRPVSALPCQLFLVCTSMLCWLRLVVPVPAGSSWRLVSAADAAQRFCLKEQRVVHDSVGARWALHGGLHEEEEEGSTDREGEKTHNHQMSPPAMMPRVVWAAWGPQAARLKGHQRATSQQPLVPACNPSSSSAKEDKMLEMDVEEEATEVLGLISALLTWEEADSQGCVSSEAPPSSHCDNADAAAEATGRRCLPMQLARNLLPACAWLRLDGRLHVSLVQLLCLRLWSLLVQRPGSTAQQLQSMLCLLDDCEVQFLLHALAEEGIVTAVVLPETYPLKSAGSDVSPTADKHGQLPSADSAKASSAQSHLDSREGFQDAAVALQAVSSLNDFSPLHAAPSLSAADYALRSQTIYLPNPVEQVLPMFQPLLLPRLATCECGCSALL
ncbi:hypothetical protein Emed_003842 [Eimeria media]